MTVRHAVGGPGKPQAAVSCKICGLPADFFARADLLGGKYNAAYYKCGRCGFVQTEEPYWLEESYCDAITFSDVGLVSRNMALSKRTRAVIGLLFESKGTFLDYGGGYGLFVRMMRDSGLDFRLYDKHCQNLFARGFEADIQQGGRFELLTAFEVLEHLTDPMAEIGRMAELSDSILFSTELLPSPCPRPGDWWYYGTDHGQHVSFYSAETLSFIAEKHGMNLCSCGSYHMLSRKNVPALLFRAVCSNIGVGMACLLYRRRSLLLEDWQISLDKVGAGRQN